MENYIKIQFARNSYNEEKNTPFDTQSQWTGPIELVTKYLAVTANDLIHFKERHPHIHNIIDIQFVKQEEYIEHLKQEVF